MENSSFLKARSDRYIEPTKNIKSATVFYIEKCDKNGTYLIRIGSKRGPSMYYSYHDWVRYSKDGKCSDDWYQFTFEGLQIAPSKQRAIDQQVKAYDHLAGDVFFVKIHSVDEPHHLNWYMEDSVWAVNYDDHK